MVIKILKSKDVKGIFFYDDDEDNDDGGDEKKKFLFVDDTGW